MYGLIVYEKKNNRIKLIFLISLLVILICMISFFVNNHLKNRKELKLSLMQYNQLQQEVEETERKQILIQIEEKKFVPLNQEKIDKISNIYHYEGKRVFLTFDDGPTKQVTPFILDYLKQEDIKASFFVLGMMVDRNPDILKRIHEEGHFIGNHGYTHKYSQIYQTPGHILEEYLQTNQAIQNALGKSYFNCRVFRYPGGLKGGKYNDIKSEGLSILNQNGIASLDWNALTEDASTSKTQEEMLQSVINTIGNKSSVVILLHDSSDKILTYEILPQLVQYLRENGYEFKTIEDVLSE